VSRCRDWSKLRSGAVVQDCRFTVHCSQVVSSIHIFCICGRGPTSNLGYSNQSKRNTEQGTQTEMRPWRLGVIYILTCPNKHEHQGKLRCRRLVRGPEINSRRPQPELYASVGARLSPTKDDRNPGTCHSMGEPTALCRDCELLLKIVRLHSGQILMHDCSCQVFGEGGLHE
jgi:hypothetical protein